MRNNKIFILVVIQILPTYCLGIESEKYTFTTCEVQKGAYVHIDEDHGTYKEIIKPTNFKVIKQATGETYSLVIENDIINLYYKGKDFSWNTKDKEENNEVKFIYKNNLPNLVFKIISSKFYYEQTYYFNLDAKGNGFMSMINVRYNNPFGNNQSLFFCTCKGFKN